MGAPGNAAEKRASTYTPLENSGQLGLYYISRVVPFESLSLCMKLNYFGWYHMVCVQKWCTPFDMLVKKGVDIGLMLSTRNIIISLFQYNNL